jgi:hypothetical protein
VIAAELLPFERRYRLSRRTSTMTQSDFDFVGQLVENRFAEVPSRLRALTLLPGWYSILLAGAVLAGAAIGFAA